MKKVLFILLFALVPAAIFAQKNHPDDICGYYYMVDPFSDEASQVHIFKNKETGKYDGLVAWVGNAAKKPYLNLVFLKGLKFNAKSNEWEDGVIKYPGKSGTYKMYMRFESPTKLRVRGYWGVSLLGKTMYWTKEKQKRIQK